MAGEAEPKLWREDGKARVVPDSENPNILRYQYVDGSLDPKSYVDRAKCPVYVREHLSEVGRVVTEQAATAEMIEPAEQPAAPEALAA